MFNKRTISVAIVATFCSLLSVSSFAICANGHTKTSSGCHSSSTALQSVDAIIKNADKATSIMAKQATDAHLEGNELILS